MQIKEKLEQTKRENCYGKSNEELQEKIELPLLNGL